MTPPPPSQFYHSFIAPIELHLSPISLVSIASAVASQHYLAKPNDEAALNAAVAFLAPLRARGAALGPAAALALDMSATLLQIRAAGAASSGTGAGAALDSARDALRAGAARLAALREGEDPSVAASVHHAHAEYYKLRGPAALFYTNALLFLGATTPAALPLAERRAMAVDVALAALVGDGIYNFGEVAEQPILGALAGTPFAWLVDMLRAFQTGNIDEFNSIVETNRAAIDAQPALVSAAGALKEKIALIALMELAAKRPAGDRSLSFKEVAVETRLPVDQVSVSARERDRERERGGCCCLESHQRDRRPGSKKAKRSLAPRADTPLPPSPQIEWMAMRAVSLGLIKASIDQVDQVLHVSHIKPRVLSQKQISALKAKVDAWREKTEAALIFVTNAANKDLFQ